MKKLNLLFIVITIILFVSVFFLFYSERLKNGSKSPVLIVPHFDLFKQKRQELLQEVAKRNNPEKIILFSVNHYGEGRNKLLTTDRAWNFKDHKILFDRDGFERLTKLSFVSAQEGPFLFEHGIKNVLPDIAKYFPKAQVVPVMVRDDISEEDMGDIFDQIFLNLPGYMPIFSIDFSHYNPSAMAKIHDAYSMKALANLDPSGAFLAETDSPQLMNLAVRWAKKTNNERFNLFYNSDSGEIMGNEEEETTSAILGFYSQGKRKSDNIFTFVFAGDAMFDRQVYESFKNRKPSDFLSKMGNRFFWGVDLSMLNLEGPITGKKPKAGVHSDSLIFNFPPESVDVLDFLRINFVSLANNHSNNAGGEGFSETVARLNEAGIKSVGSHNNDPENLLKRIESVGLPATVIAVNDQVSSDEVRGAIEQEKGSGRIVIVFVHWGVEYSQKHIGRQESLAKIWQESGADMIIGSHPHVIQGLGVIEKTPVVYSLGNFIFDQNFSRDTTEGLSVGGIISEDEIRLSFFPLKIVEQAPELIRGERRREILKKLFDGLSGFELINSDTIIIRRK